MSDRFLAIDFETANYDSDSACSIGLVRVEEGKIIAQEYHLIRPPSKNFVFTPIHGLTWKDVEKAPLFSQLWLKIKLLFQNIDFIAAHNASFDQRVLNACCERYQILPPSTPFTCTVQVARKRLKIRPAHLPSVCRSLNIPLKHHDAISDALACAKIVLAASALPQGPEKTRTEKSLQ